MKFGAKIALCMVCLISVLFGAGGAFLIYGSFNSSVKREREAAVRSFASLANSLAVCPDSEVVSLLLEQLTKRDKLPVELQRMSGTVYKRGELSSDRVAENGRITVAAENERLVLCTALTILDEEYSLAAGYDISELYRTREEQLRAFGIIFIGLVAVCAVASWFIARMLTRPLASLAGTAVKISEGDYTARSEIKTADETGVVSREFDSMAEKIEENIAELREAVLRQERFVGSFTHELKTPMTSIIGYSDLLRSGELSAEDTEDALNYIYSESRRLERLSMKLLELFTAENSGITFVSCSPSDIIADITEHLRGEYAQKGIELSAECEKGELPLEPDLFRSLITNLLDNARKSFDDGGEIKVTCGFEDEGCRITVSDNGRGIPSAALSKLTEAFFRVDKSRARASGGAGLGLALCEKIAALHNGGISFDSEEGRGTTVTVILKGGAAE